MVGAACCGVLYGASGFCRISVEALGDRRLVVCLLNPCAGLRPLSSAKSGYRRLSGKGLLSSWLIKLTRSLAHGHDLLL